MKRFYCNNKRSLCLGIFVLCLSITLSIIFAIIHVLKKEIIALLGTIIFPMITIIALLAIFSYSQWILFDEKGLKIKGIFSIIHDYKWCEIKKIKISNIGNNQKEGGYHEK